MSKMNEKYIISRKSLVIVITRHLFWDPEKSPNGKWPEVNYRQEKKKRKKLSNADIFR